jgi:DivIVA domain-containing protein
MIDESFRLTPLDVRRQQFPNEMRGYNRAQVDAFRERVADEMEDLTRRIQDMEAKARGFHEQLRAFREREKALNEALVSAQQLRTEMREQADREAQLIIREAKAEGDRLVDAARNEARRLSSDLEALDRTRRAYIMQLRQLAERQLAELDAAAAAPSPVLAPPELNGGEAAPPTKSHHPTPAWLDSLVKE